jgi:thiamine pyrophosphokinase
MKQILFNTHFNAIIYLNGDITEGDINILKTINNSVVVIAADGALNQLNNVSVDYVIGDLDSINDTTTSHNIIKDSNQNKYDFEKALDFAIANNYKNVLILGINGREYEHSINN